mmetsp:Transcript_17058/g.33333  ORF Transcript_17058/g.33333 Transcript_17058/m.33333 type:complete len:167 (+) Transcript_17058:72-572(+)
MPEGAADAADVNVDDGDSETASSKEDEDQVNIVLCEPGPHSGTMRYYLNREWDRPAVGDGEVLGDDARTGAIVPVDGSSGALARLDSRAEVIEKDENVEVVLEKIQFQMDIQEMADTPWRQPGANQQEHFNFDFDEKQWKNYLLRQIRMRLEARQRRKIGVVDGNF